MQQFGALLRAQLSMNQAASVGLFFVFYPPEKLWHLLLGHSSCLLEDFGTSFFKITMLVKVTARF